MRLGSQFDNLAHSIRIVRDPELAEDNLMLCFDDGKVVLGLDNEYALPRVLTQHTKTKLCAMLLRGDETVELSNIVQLEMRDAIEDAGEIQPLPDPALE